MAQTLLLRGAKQVLTLRGPNGVRRGAALNDLGIIEDGSVLIRDGTIAAVGTTRRIENLKEARAALEIPANGRVVMPGFVDASLGVSPESLQHKQKKITDFYEDSLTLMRSCLQHGTLSADVKGSAPGRDFHSDISVLRKLAQIGSNPVRMIRTWRVTECPGQDFATRGDLSETLEMLTRRKLIHFLELANDPERVINSSLLAPAQQANIGIKLLWCGGSSEAFAEALCRLQPRTVCCPPHLSSAECSILSNASAIAVFATGKDVFEGPAAVSVRQLAEAGGAIALSSGYESSSAATFSMQMSVALAVVRLGLTTEEALSAATINAAHAAGCAHLTGSLECGKQADILILNVSDYREVPRQFGINHVDMALRQGNVVLNRTRWKATPTDTPAHRMRS